MFKTAAYLAAFMMILLFATSEAAFDMSRGKNTVRKLLTRFRNTVVDHKSIDLKTLTSTAQSLLNDEPFATYVEQLAQDRDNCSRMAADINTYTSNFRKLLTGPGTSSSQQATGSAPDWTLNEAGVPFGIDERIPMHANLDVLRKRCAIQLQNAPLQRSPSARLSIREHLVVDREELNEAKKRITDKSGFKIELGKQHVKAILDALLQIALDKRCTEIQDLVDFANPLVNGNTELYKGLLKAVRQSSVTVLRNIDEYVREFWRTQLEGGVRAQLEGGENVHIDESLRHFWTIELQGRLGNAELIPMKEMIRAIRRECVAYIFHPANIPADPMEDIIENRSIDHWPWSG